jgi:hypothetical protein
MVPSLAVLKYEMVFYIGKLTNLGFVVKQNFDLQNFDLTVGHVYFESKDGYDRGAAEVGSIMRGDIPDFTNVIPVRQIREILD